MCTVTILPTKGGYRLVHNRDERRDRPASVAPSSQHGRYGRATFPVDAQEGGTWIGYREEGWSAFVINLNPHPAPPILSPISRGLLLKHLLLEARDLEDAALMVSNIQRHHRRPFRLGLVDTERVLTFSWSGTGDLQREKRPMNPSSGFPMVFTSSGGGDERALEVRMHMLQGFLPFDEMNQDAFHRYQDPLNPVFSPLMTHPVAATRSISTIERHGNGEMSFDFSRISS